MTKGTRKPGEFCWINIVTPQPEPARAFFGAVLGWSYAEMPGMGHRVRVGAHDIGGLFDIVSPRTPNGMPPIIGVMVKVESADATGAKAVALGGKAMPAFDIMEAGRMVVCHDPDGAQFDAWEPRSMPGTQVDGAMHGAPSWFEALTSDVDRAAAFYSVLFGWMPEVMPMPGSSYTRFWLGDAPVAGMMPIIPPMGDLRPGWGTYFTVKDADEAAREAVRLGGRLTRRLMDVPAVGRSCGITSPQGVAFNVVAYTR